jgi:hypothetical protein
VTIGSYMIAFVTITLLLPGYIVSLLLSMARRRKSEEAQFALFRWFVLGTICELPWLALGFLILAPHWKTDAAAWVYVTDHRFVATGLWVLAIFGWPFVVGRYLIRAEARWVKNKTQSRIDRFVGQLVAAQGPINDDSAWDTKFTEIEGVSGQWVLIVLISGDWIAGVLGKGSDVSVDPKERDLYIADVRYTSLDDQFPNLQRTGGILIPAGQIRLIYFWQ